MGFQEKKVTYLRFLSIFCMFVISEQFKQKSLNVAFETVT